MASRYDASGKLACSWLKSCPNPPAWRVVWRRGEEVSFVCEEHLRHYGVGAEQLLDARVAELNKEVQL